MPDVKAVFAEEVKRLAKKEIKAAMVPLDKQIASLKKEIERLNEKISILENSKNILTSNSENIVYVNEHEKKRFVQKSPRISGRKLVKFRHRQGLTQTELAKLLDVTTLTISNWELEKNSIRESIRGRIIDLCSMSASELEKLIAEKLPEHRQNVKRKNRLIRFQVSETLPKKEDSDENVYENQSLADDGQ